MIKITKIYKDTRVLENGTLETLGLAIKNDNNVDVWRFKFDSFVDGVASLLTTLEDDNNEKVAFPLVKNLEENSYDLVITQAITSQPQFDFQLLIVNENDDEIWHSRIATLQVLNALDIGSSEMPSSIENWLENANLVMSGYENQMIEWGQEIGTAIDNCEIATSGAEKVNITQSKSNHVVTITTTNRNGADKSENITEPTATITKQGKVATITLTDSDGTTSKQVKDGASFEYNWNGTKLGVKTDEEQNYEYVDLEGPQGPKGDTGKPFMVKKTYISVAQMNADFNNMELGDYVMIASSVEIEDNAKLYVRGENQWIFITDFSGATGIQGETGATPNIQIGNVTQGITPNVVRRGTDENPIFDFTLVKGDKGDTGQTGQPGATGNGISNIAKTGTSGLIDTYTITYTNGNTDTFDVTNGQNGDITDVKVDGTSVVENHEANILTTGYSTTNKLITEKDYDRAMSIYNILPKVNGTGETISLDNTGVAPLNMDLKGNTSQIQATLGKNIYHTTQYTLNNIQSGLPGTITTGDIVINYVDNNNVNFRIQTNAYRLITTQTYILEPNTTYTISFTRTDTANNPRFYVYNVDNNDDYSGNSYLGNEIGQIVVSFTTNEYGKVAFAFGTGNTDKGKTIDIANIQLELGNTATEFEPFSNLQPAPTPSNPQDICVVKGDNTINNITDNLVSNTIKTETINGLSIINQGDDGILFNGTTTGEVVRNGDYFFLPIGNYKMSAEIIGSVSSSAYISIFDNGTEKKSINLNNYIVASFNLTKASNNMHLQLYCSANRTFNNMLVKLKITGEDGVIAYSLPSKYYPINLGVRNLFDKNAATYKDHYFINSSGEETYTDVSGYTTSYVGVLPNTTYTLSGKIGNDRGNIGIYYYDSNKTFISRTTFVSNAYTFTTTNNCYYIQFQYRLEFFEPNTILIEQSDTRHSYTPYGADLLELCKIGNYQDYIYKSEGKWYKYGIIGKKVLDGSETWLFTNNVFYSVNAITDYKTSNGNICKCDRYLSQNNIANSSSLTTNNRICFYTSNETIRTYIRDERYSDYTNFKTALSNEKPIVYYVLADAKIIEITNETLIQELNDLEYAMSYQTQTNISQTNQDKPFVINAETLLDISNLENRVTLLEE